MVFFKFIYYLIGLLFLLFALYSTLNSKEIVSLFKQFKDSKKSFQSLTEMVGKEKSDLLKGIMYSEFAYLIWLLIGLFSFNWVIILAVIMLSMLIYNPLTKLFQYSFAHVILHSIMWFIEAIAIGFIIINTYHLKIDLFPIAKNLFLQIF